MKSDYSALLAEIMQRDAEVPVDRACHCDAAAFWVPGAGCSICGHMPEVHGDDPQSCVVRVPYRMSQVEVDRRVLLGIVKAGA